MLENIINAAQGKIKADIVLKNGKVIDVLNHRITEGNVAVKDGVILGIGEYEGIRKLMLKGRILHPDL